jgi:Domain of unknown function (DUF6487)
MTTKNLCSSCQIEMERGFVGDWTQGGIRQSAWTSGMPEEMRGFFGLVPTNSIPIMAFRCPKCGQLQFFALAK